MNVVGAIRPLYHYTSNAGLIGIITGANIWFSDIRFLNDSKEYKHACDILARNIIKYSGRYRQLWIDNGCAAEQFDRMIRNMYDKSNHKYVFAQTAWKGIPFVFSLSEIRDSLSQWRAYGNGEYCLEFDISEICNRYPVKLIKIIYSSQQNEDVDPDVKESLDDFFTTHVRHIYLGGVVDQEVYHAGIDDVIYRLVSLDFFVKHKDDGFAGELEWRLVSYVDQRNESIFFLPNGRYPRPRIKLSALEKDDVILNSVTEVMSGPGLDHELFQSAMAIMNPSFGAARFKLAHSTVPYRP